MCDIILFYVDCRFEWIHSIYTNECYFCCRRWFPGTICSSTVADLGHKVSAAAITSCNLETHIQICVICVVVSESGLHQRIMVDIGLPVEMKLWGNILGLVTDSL
jgi:hypothetical protein